MTKTDSSSPKRLFILASKLGYQTRGFADAARKLGAEVAFGSDRCHQLDDPWQDGAVALHFNEPVEAAQAVVASSGKAPIHAILALGDRPTVAAAYAARALGLTYNSPQAVENCRSKLPQRELLRAAGLPVPEFFSFDLVEDFGAVLARVEFPCVVKPLTLAASQGVIRANSPEEFLGAVWRIKALLESPELQATREPQLDRLLVERYIPGEEVAVEALLENGRLRVLAIFDKPDPLEGPFFEETIYVTPSRLAAEIQRRIVECTERTVTALGLAHGPLHAEFRIHNARPWILEVSPRPIGGLCSRALRFGPQKIYLEELLVRHALGMDCSGLDREADAAGVMMIPIPQSGVLERVEGIEEAAAWPGVEEIRITARPHDFISAWPEGSSYLGFIFARAAAPLQAEAALRRAHARLRIVLSPRLVVEHPLSGKLSVEG